MTTIHTAVEVFDSNENGTSGVNDNQNIGRRHVVIMSRVGTGTDDVFLELRNIGWASSVVVQSSGGPAKVEVSLHGSSYVAGGSWHQNSEAGSLNIYALRAASLIGSGISWLPHGLTYPFIRFIQTSGTAAELTVLLQA